ncbi:MAG: phenylacetate--CoA ligase [Candidatus Bathyarchaeia archaeon]|nr:phenylacetate--CoA ligase [Candidatus Bathyarchaeota archaeon]
MAEDRFWQPKIEKMPPKSLIKIQTIRLKETIRNLFKKNTFYRRKLLEKGLKPTDIKGVDQLEMLPFTTKFDFRENYPLGLLACSMSRVIRLHASSGTTGDPTIVAYTRRDIENWADCIARCLTMTGITERDVFQVILGYGLFTGGLGFHYGAEKIGATVVPSATGNTRRQVKLMRDLKVTAFTSIPSYTLYLAETAKASGIDPEKDLNVNSVSCGAEVWSEATRKRIEREFGCKVYNSYGLSEVCGPGVAFECSMQDGLHLWGDHFLAEIVDPKTGERLGVEEEGELVLTTLTRKAMPLIRYRTGDLTKILDGACNCGRTHQRIGWIKGRCDDMLKVKGVNLFPSQIEAAIMGLEGVGNSYQILLSRRGHLDEATVEVEATEELWSRGEGSTEELAERVRAEIGTVTGLNIQVRIVPPSSIPRMEGKVKRVVIGDVETA